MASTEQGDEPADGMDEAEPSGSRARLAFATGFSALLIVVVAIVVLSRPKEDAQTESECVTAWNDDPVAPTSDGTHAYADHLYRDTLVTRVAANGEVLDPEAALEKKGKLGCAVIFATTEVLREPDFGVRVYEDGRWIGLPLLVETSQKEIEDIQQAAVESANATLLPTGKLSQE